MSGPPSDRNDAVARLHEGARGLGIDLDGSQVEALSPFVERVEGALTAAAWSPLSPSADVGGGASGGTGRDLAPDARGPAPTVDDSAWVWRTAPDGPVASEPSEAEGQLRGWRLGVKDLVAVAGRPLRCGSAATFDAPPEPVDAPVVSALRQAGAVVVGATKLHEFAFGTTGLNAAFGTPANPAAPGRVPGGSSSGSGAAVAAGEADVALGTDTGGSVRIPAALCGVVGHKPALGAISTGGVVALSPTLDHVGYLVSDVGQLRPVARALGLLRGAEERAAGVRSAGGRGRGAPIRLGVARGVAELCDEAVAAAWSDAVASLGQAGCRLVDVDWPGGELVFAATTAIMFAEAAHGHAARLAARHHLYGADVRNRLLQGAAFGAGTYLAAREVRRALRACCLDVLSDVDAVLTPTVPMVAPRLEEAVDPAVGGRLVTFTRLADLTGLPAVSLPVPGTTLPVGLQVEAADDATVLAVAAVIGRRLAGG